MNFLTKKFLINDPKPHRKQKFPKEYKFRLSKLQIRDIMFQFKNLEYQRKLREQNYLIYCNGIKNKKINFFHNEQNLLNDNAYLNFPILVDNKKNFIDYMLDNKIDLNPQFYRSVNELSMFNSYTDKTRKIQDSVSKITTLPTYSQINKNYIQK